MSQGQPGQPPPMPGGYQGQPDPPPPHDAHAMRHDTQATRTYPCGTCGGELEFHIGQQRLVCPHCGNAQELTAQGLRPVQEQDLHSAITAMKANAAAQQSLVQGEKEVVCQNCGGRTTFTGTLTSERCPYCATPIQRDDVHNAPARLPVDGVLPFTVDRKTAEEKLKAWVSSRWFAPGEFKEYSRTGSFESVYAAYYTFDARARTTYDGERGEHYDVTTGHGDERRTERKTRWRGASGVVNNAFDDVMVFANTGINPGHVQALEPWPLEQVAPFNPQYLAGHLARTYDLDLEQGFEAAKERMEPEIDTTIRRDIGGDEQRIHRKDTRWSSLTYKHLLIPLWLLTVIYAGQPFQVLINGRTGEVAGERPYDKVKIAVAVLVAVVVIAVLVFLLTR